MHTTRRSLADIDDCAIRHYSVASVYRMSIARAMLRIFNENVCTISLKTCRKVPILYRLKCLENITNHTIDILSDEKLS